VDECDARSNRSFEGISTPSAIRPWLYYDLRLAKADRHKRISHSEFVVYGFCYYHYWFHGRRLLEKPFQGVLDSVSPSLPFCLCWANEN
jgi:hypothetical protein